MAMPINQHQQTQNLSSSGTELEFYPRSTPNLPGLYSTSLNNSLQNQVSKTLLPPDKEQYQVKHPILLLLPPEHMAGKNIHKLPLPSMTTSRAAEQVSDNRVHTQKLKIVMKPTSRESEAIAIYILTLVM